MKFEPLFFLPALLLLGMLCHAQGNLAIKLGDPDANIYKELGSPTIEFPLKGKWIRDYGDYIITSSNGIVIAVNNKGDATYIEEAEKAAVVTSASEILLAKAREGDAKAQCRLAFCYQTGMDVPMDKAECIRWYTTAALQGNMAAQHNLGVIYMNGEGTKRDFEQAYAWAVLAADNGNDTLLKALDPILVPEQQEAGRRRARGIRKKMESPTGGAAGSLSSKKTPSTTQRN